MKITPQSTITLYSGVDIGTEQQLAFSSKAKQTAYFASKVKKSYVNCTVVKDKIGVIKVAVKPVGQAGTSEITGSDLASCNYMSFVNPNFDNKTIYAYIVDYSYENNETALIQYMIDYWQTWCFDVTYHDMFIDREHLSQDEWTKVEANPYRSDVPQMITEEPLPTPMGYEKPFYQVEWWDPADTSDGFAVMSGRDGQHADNIQEAINMVNGAWDYWRVMLIQAPTDWDSFGEVEDDGSTTTTWRVLDVVWYDAKFYMCQNDTDTFSPSDTTNWSDITSAFDNYDPTNVPPLTDTDNPTIASYHYAIRSDGTVWRNTDVSSQTFCINDMGMQDGFEQIKMYANAENKVKGELLAILDFFSTVTITESSNVALKNGNNRGITWSVKPKGADIYFINSRFEFQRLANFYSRYNAVSQIIGLYGIPRFFLDHGLIDKDSLVATPWGNMYSSDNFSTTVSSARTNMSGAAGQQKTVVNKKLYTSPFSYLRLYSPDGKVKEFSYERFANVSENAGTAVTFKIIATIDGDEPKMYLIPYKYKTKINIANYMLTGIDDAVGVTGAGEDWEKAMNFNCDEAVCVQGFPQIAFNTDGYLTFLSASYNQFLSEDTRDNFLNLQAEGWDLNADRIETRNNVRWITNLAEGAAGGAQTGNKLGGTNGAVAGALIGTGLSAIPTGYQTWDSSETYKYNSAIFKDKLAKYQAAEQYAAGDLLSTDNPYVDRFKKVKAAYANSVYTGGSGGVIRYIRGMGLFDFVLLHVQLRPEILGYYDHWFDLYGYASGRCGIPHVIDFVKGETGATKVPHWATVNSKNTTYVKTCDAKIEHAMLPVASNIAAMFNAGIRFIKGDLS